MHSSSCLLGAPHPRLVTCLPSPLHLSPPAFVFSPFLQLASSAVAWNECGTAWCCRNEWKFSTANESTEASLRAYEECQATTPTVPLVRPGPSPAPTPEPMHLLCYNSGAATFPSCPGTNASAPPPPPPPYYQALEVCSSSWCLHSGWPSLFYGRPCYFSARFAYPMTCALWAATLGSREVVERKVAYGGPAWDPSWGGVGSRFGLTADEAASTAAAAAVAGTDAAREPAAGGATAHADRGVRQLTGEGPTAGARGQDLDAHTLALLEALAPMDVWVKHGVVQPER